MWKCDRGLVAVVLLNMSVPALAPRLPLVVSSWLCVVVCLALALNTAYIEADSRCIYMLVS